MTANTPAPLRVCHIEDDVMPRNLLERILPDFGSYHYHCHFESAQDFIAAWPLQAPPHIILLDLWLKHSDARHVLAFLQRQEQSLPVLILSGDDELHHHVDNLLELGALGFLHKNDYLRLGEAMTTVLQGRIYWNDIMEEAIRHRSAKAKEKPGELLRMYNSLSSGQKRFAIYSAIFHNLTYKELAVKMGAHPATLSTFCKRCFARMALGKRTTLNARITELWEQGALGEFEEILAAHGWKRPAV